MNKRRSFFKAIMGAVAAVALAPELAFGVKFRMPRGFPPPDETWTLAVAELASHTHWHEITKSDLVRIKASIAGKKARYQRMLDLSDMDKGRTLC